MHYFIHSCIIVIINHMIDIVQHHKLSCVMMYILLCKTNFIWNCSPMFTTVFILLISCNVDFVTMSWYYVIKMNKGGTCLAVEYNAKISIWSNFKRKEHQKHQVCNAKALQTGTSRYSEPSNIINMIFI